MRLTARALRLFSHRSLARAETARPSPVRGSQVSRTVPGNETEDRDAVLRQRIQRFAGVEISAGFDTVEPRPDLILPVTDEGRLSSRVLRFVHRRDARS